VLVDFAGSFGTPYYIIRRGRLVEIEAAQGDMRILHSIPVLLEPLQLVVLFSQQQQEI
jgi:hypothetical protein